jgi:hypothetical protein
MSFFTFYPILRREAAARNYEERISMGSGDESPVGVWGESPMIFSLS